MEPQMQMFNTKKRNKFYSWGREDKFFMLIVINIFFLLFEQYQVGQFTQ